METNQLLINLLLYGILPLWGISGFIDWCCHRATKIETTSGIKESLIHSLMGIQLGIPIILCVFFEVNVLILLICFLAWFAHEFVAHWDVHYSSEIRHISIWEMHAHNYLATIPLYSLAIISVLKWDMVIRFVTLDWAGAFHFQLLETPIGGPQYFPWYLVFMAMTCIFPYVEENIRCLIQAYKEPS